MSSTLLQIVKRHQGMLLTAGIALTLGWAAVSGSQGIDGLLEKQDEIRQLQEQNAKLQAENTRRKERVRRLESSPSDQDEEIRRLNKLKPGEMMFMLPDAEKHKSSKQNDKAGTSKP
jgi:cell division protein FtsB